MERWQAEIHVVANAAVALRSGVMPELGQRESYRLPMADDRPPICATCGVTMVPAALSADENADGEWVCLECEELDEDK